jgi:hypothetical protein
LGTQQTNNMTQNLFFNGRQIFKKKEKEKEARD